MLLKKSRIPFLKKSIFSLVLILLLGVAAFCLPPPGFAQGSNDFSLAPVNPEFSEYLQSLKMGKVQQPTVNGYPPGYIPSPLNLSHLKGKTVFHRVGIFPANYDLRTLGKLTPVKNQGNCGSCWTFATYGSLESYLLPSETWDFSENNLKNTHGFDWAYNEGGNRDMSMAYLARWSGPVNESDDPYNPSSGTSPPGLSPQKHIQNAYYIPDRGNSLDNDNIKQAIMNYGAIYTTMNWDDAHYNASNCAYYFDDSGYPSNHAVAIVGWDDNFITSKFNTAPAGNGAFIIKNSWGTGWGQSGYFYVSYYDVNIGKENAAFNNAEPTKNYSNIYQYDPYGWIDSVGESSGTNATAYGANIFTASTSDPLAAVSIYTASPNSTYELSIYKDVNDTSGPATGTLAGSKAGTITLPGYNTVKLDAPVPLTSGQKFSVVIKLTTPGYGYPIPVEYPWPDYASNATSNPKESWVSLDGSYWWDLTNIGFGNACIKAFTESPSVTVTSPNGSENWQPGSTQTISWTYTGNPGSAVKIELLKGGTVNSTIVDSTSIGSGGSGTYSWAIPAGQASGNDYKVRVTSTTNSSCTDSSDSSFTIGTPSSLNVTSPNGGESWMAGGTYNITWSYTDSPGSNVKIDLYKGTAFNSTIVASTPAGTSGTGSYRWLIPSTLAAGSDYKVKVSSTTDSTAADYSDNYFRIRPRPPLLVTSPNGGESWMAGGIYDIKWSYTGSPGSYVKVELYKGTAFNSTIVASTPVGTSGIGSYRWTIPSTLVSGNDYKVKITSTTDSTITDYSNDYFRIRPRPPLLVTSPNGGESWMAGGTYDIKWSYTGSPGSYVKIDLYKGTAFNRTIVASTPVGTSGTGSYRWLIPAGQAAGSDYRVKITSTTSSSISDYSNDYFRIRPRPPLLVTSPNGGENWMAGGTYNITWSYTGSPGSYVKIDLYKGTAFNRTIITSTPVGTSGIGSYRWTLPSTLVSGNDYKVKITSIANSSIADYSNDYFRIRPFVNTLIIKSIAPKPRYK